MSVIGKLQAPPCSNGELQVPRKVTGFTLESYQTLLRKDTLEALVDIGDICQVEAIFLVSLGCILCLKTPLVPTCPSERLQLC